MTMISSSARLAALALGVSLVMSCDTRLPTQAGSSIDDVTRPTVKFVLSTGTNNTVDVGASASVSVTASDDKGVSTVLTTVRTGALVLNADTATLSPTQLTTTRVVPLKLVGLVNGDHVTIRTTVTDAAFNTKVDSLVVAIADTTAPVVTVNSTAAGKALKGSDTIDVRLTASDSSGLKYVGYRMLFPRATDSLLIKTDSVFVPTGTAPRVFGPTSFKFAIPDTAPVGQFVIVGFAKDASGLVSKSAASISFTVVDLTRPKLTFVAPALGAKLNVGDSLLVTAHITDNVGIKSVAFTGLATRGNPALGTQDTTVRYPTITAPTGSGFRLGLKDTTITRYLKVATPIDTLKDSLLVVGVVTDQANNADTTRIKVFMVSGPNVIFKSPLPGDSANRGAGLTVAIEATHSIGVASLGFRVQGDPSWPTKLDTTIVYTLASPLKIVDTSATIQIPADAPFKSLITITPISTDVNGEDGSSSPITIAIRAGLPPGPRVTQFISPRVETSDSITITALGSGITWVGFELTDGTGAPPTRDSVAVPPPFPSTAIINMPLNLPRSTQGKRITIKSFAYDQGGRIGYSLRAGVTNSQSNPAAAFVDTALVVYGRTYPLPVNRNGTIADVQVDATRGNIFLSNINYGRVEVWSQADSAFAPTGIIVGSQPWGMTVSRTASPTGGAGAVLYVANSGGTNLSRVNITGPAKTMAEDLGNRLLTRVSYLFQLSEIRDVATNQIRIGPVTFTSFSDRPQYVEQSAAGRLYISTKPTSQAPLGTIRFVDPNAAAPDERFILDFAAASSDPNQWVVANADGVSVLNAPPNTTQSDVVTICDHQTGTASTVQYCQSSNLGVGAACAALQADPVAKSDIECKQHVDVASLGLTDTTFVASSGDGNWITYGEGHRAPVARNFLLQDNNPAASRYNYASSSLNIIDLMNNQSDQVFGVALDKTGKMLGVHGTETAFSLVTTPFTQRLQGKHNTFATGSGIAFHPNADGPNTPSKADRLAFVASANGTIEALDIAYYDFVRGSLATKLNLYGPLRATLPFPTDPPAVLYKLFGVSAKGLVVVDVTAADLVPLANVP